MSSLRRHPNVDCLPRFEEELREAAVCLAGQAAAHGYRGPCGIDAFSFRGPQERLELRPLVEFNARFTMGSVALGILRRVLRSEKQNLGLSPGELRRFVVNFDGKAPEVGWEAVQIGLEPGLQLAIEAA